MYIKFGRGGGTPASSPFCCLCESFFQKCVSHILSKTLGFLVAMISEGSCPMEHGQTAPSS